MHVPGADPPPYSKSNIYLEELRGVTFFVYRPIFPLGVLLSTGTTPPLFPCTMDLEGAIERIRGVLVGSAPDVQRRLLQRLLDSFPAHGTPSVLMAEDYVKIFRHLLFSALFPHAGNPTPPWNNSIVLRTMARGWVFSRVQEEMIQGDWIHRACLLQIQSCARRVLVIWAWRDYPLRIPPCVMAQFGLALSTISSFA